MKKILKIFAILFFAASCSQNGEVLMQNIDNQWNKNNILTFEFEIKNSAIPKNIIFVVRNNNDYPFSNIRLFANLQDANKKNLTKTDTLNYLMAEPNGKWLGHGFGQTKEILFFYRRNFKFPKDGKYFLTTEQAMRKDTLRGIEDFGIRIE